MKVKFAYPKGVKVERIYYVDSNGEKITFEGSYFTVSDFDVTFGAEAERIEYTVKFISDGKVISSAVAYYGDTPQPPADPKKASDGNYNYTFVGWSAEIVPVTADVVYTAVYDAAPIPPKVDDGTLQVTDSVLRYIVFAVALGSVFVGVVIPSSIISISLLISRKKKRIKIKKSQSV